MLLPTCFPEAIVSADGLFIVFAGIGHTFAEGIMVVHISIKGNKGKIGKSFYCAGLRTVPAFLPRPADGARGCGGAR